MRAALFGKYRKIKDCVTPKRRANSRVSPSNPTSAKNATAAAAISRSRSSRFKRLRTGRFGVSFDM